MLLSSGVAGTSQPEPGTDFEPEDELGDNEDFVNKISEKMHEVFVQLEEK